MKKILFTITFVLSMMAHLPAQAIVMTFSGGTVEYYEYKDFDDKEKKVGEGFMFSTPWDINPHGVIELTGYEKNGLYLEINTGYEVYLGCTWFSDSPSFHITPPFEPQVFYLTSGGSFNLNSLDLIVASNVSRWDINDCGQDCHKDDNLQYALTASNGAGYLFPTSSTIQDLHLNFGDLFYNIDYFMISTNGGYLDDPAFVINNIAVTPNNITVTQVPAPAAGLLLALGLLALWGHRSRLPKPPIAGTAA